MTDQPTRRTWDTGTVRPYRIAPPNFREAFLRLGWSKELREELRCNDRCIRRWIEESGGDDLRAARSAVTGHPVKPRNRSKRYVLGLTLTAVSDRTSKE